MICIKSLYFKTVLPELVEGSQNGFANRSYCDRSYFDKLSMSGGEQ